MANERSLYCFVAFVALTCVSRADVLHYGGDFALSGYDFEPPASSHGDIGQFWDNFSISTLSAITSISGNFWNRDGVIIFNFAQIEIRTGMATGTPGSTDYIKNDTPATITPTGRTIGQMREYRVSCSVQSLVLQGGEYWLRINPVNAWGISATTGSNGVGPAVGDHRSFFYSNYYGPTFYQPVTTVLPGHPGDFSYMVEGNPVPEPMTVSILAIGVAGICKRRKAKNPSLR